MRWEDERQSDSVDDVRGESGGGGGGFGGGGMGGGIGLLGLLPLLLRGGPIGIIVLVIIGAVMFGGPLLRGGGGEAPQRAPSGYQGDAAATQAAGAADPQAQDLRFVKAVTAYTEDTWGEIFQEMGRTYQRPRVEVYSRSYPTACGQGSAEMGPFYCPGDRKVYLDLAFFNELSSRFGAPGRFAQAYVIAHEVGHHVQNLLGRMDQRQASGLGGSRNQTSVRTELQADCYAGVWANRTNARTHFLDPGDVEQGLAAASAVGDDTLQRQAQGRVVPDSFTHGSAAQRTHWFKAGFDSGDIKNCDTFSEGYGEL